MSSFTCSGGSSSTFNSSFSIYSVEGVDRTTVGFAGNEDASAASLLGVLDRLRMHAGLFLGCKDGIILHVLEYRKLLVEDIW